MLFHTTVFSQVNAFNHNQDQHHCFYSLGLFKTAQRNHQSSCIRAVQYSSNTATSELRQMKATHFFLQYIPV